MVEVPFFLLARECFGGCLGLGFEECLKKFSPFDESTANG